MSSATGNPRNKVSLKPGHSLMDWIRLGNSGKDLAGTGGAYLSVTKTQLAQHNKPDDAWLCIRGKVYNVTSYMNFHPGGPEELMKGVGTDATKLFNEVHAWVNYESILQKCVVGQMRTSCDENIDITSSLSPPGTPIRPKSSSQQNGPAPQKKPFHMDWFQQVGSICLVFYTKNPSPDVHIELEADNVLCVMVNGRGERLTLEGAVSWSASGVTVDPAGKVQVRLMKQQPGLWSRYGSLQPWRVTQEHWEVTLAHRTELTHNTYQLDLQYTQNVYNHVPVGHHVFLRAAVNDEEVERPYTPVTSLAGLNIPPAGCVRVIVKSYTDGKLSAWLCRQPVGTQLQVSQPLGSFTLTPVTTSSLSHLTLCAAGTGLTPMVSLISWALRSTRLKVQLICFNKTEKDIIWQDLLEQLTHENSRFSVDHVLSEPSSQWSGKKGQISPSLLQSYLPTSSPDIPNPYYVCFCGPTSFTQLAERCLRENLNFSPNSYYCFLGQ